MVTCVPLGNVVPADGEVIVEVGAVLSADALVPQETIETLEEDAEWLKRPTTSVARSS